MPTSSSKVCGMETRRTLARILADNLNFFMSKEGCPYPNANSLAVAARVAPNSVRNLLAPSKRTVTADKPEGFPQLDTVQKVAAKLGLQVWELFHPDIERSLREREIYAQLEAGLKAKLEAKSAPARTHRTPVVTR